ncbi:MAG: DUF5317 family protein [Actinomycetota bacterium]
MILAVTLLLLGIFAGLARGGKLSNIGEIRFRLPGLVFVGLALQVGAELFAAFNPAFRRGSVSLLVLAVSYAALIGFLVVNRQLPGTLFMGAGLGLNLLVILLNNGMPVSLRASRAAGIAVANYLEGAIKHVEMGPETKLGFLGDVLPLPIFGLVVSVGDLVLGIGMFVLVDRLVRYDPRRRAARRRLSGIR